MQISRRNFFKTTLSASAVGAATVVAGSIPFAEEAFGEPRRTWSFDAETSSFQAADAKGVIWINSNENPYGPWASMMPVMRDALAAGNRYPRSEYEELLSTIANLHRVKESQVALGCGSSEILRICAEVFCGPGKTLVQASPTFESLGQYAKTRGTTVRAELLTRPNYAHDLEKMRPRSGERVGLVYICNPNNPTASITPRKDIEAYIKELPSDTSVLIDEAYHHFALNSPDYISFLDKPINDSRVLVARTFSKVYGLAGMRLGYVIGTEEVTRKMRAYASFDNVNVASARVGAAALKDDAGLAAAIKRITGDRDAFLAEVKKRNVSCIPTQANFAMLDTEKPIRQVIDYFRTKNIMIGRPFPPLGTHARITIGTPSEMKAFWNAWDGMKA
jgi:histidinol-phosphate aminotransferase